MIFHRNITNKCCSDINIINYCHHQASVFSVSFKVTLYANSITFTVLLSNVAYSCLSQQ